VRLADYRKSHGVSESMALWQVQPLAKRLVRGSAAIRPVRDEPAAPAQGRGMNIGTALGWLLGGYAVVTGLVAWMLSTGHAQDGPILALAPVTLLVSIFVALAALAMTVFGGRRYLPMAMGTLGLSVGTAVAAGGAMVAATF
jgi:hypothetical protein